MSFWLHAANDVCDRLAKGNGPHFELEGPRLHLGNVEQLLGEREQGAPPREQVRPDLFAAAVFDAGTGQELNLLEDPLEGDANLVTHVAEECRLRATRGLRRVHRTPLVSRRVLQLARENVDA